MSQDAGGDKMSGKARVEILSRQEAEERREAILAQVGDEEKFRDRGEYYELDLEDTLLFNELRQLEYLLYG